MRLLEKITKFVSSGSFPATILAALTLFNDPSSLRALINFRKNSILVALSFIFE
uniref:Uncharacterized protein n=1 Tax=Parascaris equorum TaxID=6256 RepID=A0A914RMV7_PAREQ